MGLYYVEHQNENKVSDEDCLAENVTQAESSENGISCSKINVDDDDGENR